MQLDRAFHLNYCYLLLLLEFHQRQSSTFRLVTNLNAFMRKDHLGIYREGLRSKSNLGRVVKSRLVKHLKCPFDSQIKRFFQLFTWSIQCQCFSSYLSLGSFQAHLTFLCYFERSKSMVKQRHQYLIQVSRQNQGLNLET